MTVFDSLIAAEIAREEETEAQEERRANLVPRERLEELRREHVFGSGKQIKPARLEDLRGMPKVRENVERITAFFKNHRDFAKRGARIQPGILLEGPAGAGKTLTARIIATESGAKLIDAGSFPRSDRWWTAEDVVALFSLAREYHAKTGKPVIVYIDRLESLCDRKLSDGGTTALLSELDGISGKPEGVFVIGATTKPERLEPEVLRDGRLGFRIKYFCPTQAGRLDILRYYVERKPHEPIDFQTLSQVMPSDTTPASARGGASARTWRRTRGHSSRGCALSSVT